MACTVRLSAYLSRPGMSCNVEIAAIWARLASTTTCATIAAQPDIQPARDPSARAPQVKLVPQSGIRELSDLYAYEMNRIGMKASSMMSGALTPTASET